jgi:hypothetical protein
MRSTNIKLKDLLKLRLTEAEEEKPAKEEPEEKADDAGEEEENPFASGDDAKGGDDEEAKDDKEAKPEAPKGIVVQFKRPSVKRYNNQEFLDTQGELVGLNKDGAKVKISDGSIILVNFNDII